MKRIGVLTFVGFVALYFVGSAAWALDLGEWDPGLKLSPFLSERVEYETNVFQTPSHSKDDVIFKTIPGFVADYTLGAHSLSAGYRAEILRYVDLTNQDTVHHIAAGQLRLDCPRLQLGRTEFTTSSDRDYTSHGVAIGLRGDLTAKLSSSFRAGYYLRVPEHSDQPGFSGFRFGGDFTYRPTERTTIVLIGERSPQESTF